MSKGKLLLVGAGGFGRVVSEFAAREYKCAFIDDGHELGEVICGIPVIGDTDNLAILFRQYKKLVVTIGNNKVREKLYREARRIGFTFPNIIGNNVYISPFATIGNGCVFENNVCIQNGSSVGDGTILNPGVEIHHDSSVGNYSLVYTNSVIRTYACVKNRVKIGSNVTISNSVIIEDDAEVADGCSVTGRGVM